MDPKLKVFLSSAQFNEEFTVEREVLPTIFNKQPLTAGFYLWRIEDFSSPEDIETHYSRNVNNSDLVILLLGKTLRPAVASEFRLAKNSKIPVFTFVKNIHEKDPEMMSFIDEIKPSVTYATYSSFSDLVNKIENSLLQYYSKDAVQPDVVRWREEHSKRKNSSQDERSLRLIAGILASDAASSTKTKVINALIIETMLSVCKTLDQETIIKRAMKIIHSEYDSTRDEIVKGIEALVNNGIIHKVNNNNLDLDSTIRKQYEIKRSKLADADNQLFSSLYSQHRDLLNLIDFKKYCQVLTEVITQVVYDTAVDMAEHEFGSHVSPFSYDADELNRIVADALSNIPGLLDDGIAHWQQAVVLVLQSNDLKVVSWLNRLRKAYWALTVLGMDPKAIEYTSDHLRHYCIYLDSHIVIRAMVKAGGESAMCQQILQQSKKLGIEMRISEALFKEIQQAFWSAHKTYHSSGKDIPRAMNVFEALKRKNDIFDGYLAAKMRNPDLSWENFMNRFYSTSESIKLEKYLAN